LERQEITNYKKQKLEEDKRRQLEDRRNRSEAKLQEIKKTLVNISLRFLSDF